MNLPRPYERHNLFPNIVYKDIGIPPWTTRQNYEALHTDAFTPRSDDIVIATYSKSGTTWLQNMVYNLVGCPNGPIERISLSVPWLQSLGVTLEDFEKMKGPRVFKTHDYWSWMPEKLRETARFIYCSRNPKDQAVSYFHHMKTLKDVHYGEKCAGMTFNEFFDQIQTKKDVVEFGLWEDHNLEWLEQSSRTNILFLTYEDLKEDTEREIRKIAEFLELSEDEERIVHTRHESQFEHMKNSNKLNYSWFLGSNNFMRKGEVGGWVDYLTEEQSAYFEKPIQRVIEAGGKDHKLRCPDYQGCDPDAAFRDFSERIRNYKKAYETLCLSKDRDLSFIRVSNITQFHINNLASTVQSKSAYFLMNIRPHTKTTLYLSRHGESVFNEQAKIGGDSNLSENGTKYAKELGKFLQENNLTEIPVWTSILKRTIETCAHLPNQNVQRYKCLNEIDAGRCDGLTYRQIEDLYPEEFALRDLDKYNYRYPQGESYQDVCCRLEPIIMDLEKQDQVLVICHQAVLRCIVGYFLNLSTEEIPYIKIPLHTVIKIAPVAYGCEKEEIQFGVESTVTHRDKQTQESIERRLLALDISTANISENGHS